MAILNDLIVTGPTKILGAVNLSNGVSVIGNIQGNNLIIIDSDNTITASINSAGEVEGQTFNAKSDKRLKENIIDYQLPTAKSILNLPIKKFDFIKGTKNQIGCLAQDLQEICPEIVNEGDDGYLSIQESKIIYLVIDELKKLRKEFDEYKQTHP